MRAALGLFSLEEGLTALTAGTAATATAALYCGVGGSDVFLILVGIFALGVAGVCASARCGAGQKKLLRVAQWLQWANLALFFLIGMLICGALGGNFHWAYAHPAAHAHLLGRSLLDLAVGEDAWPTATTVDDRVDGAREVMLQDAPEGASEGASEGAKPPEVWALGGGLDPGQQMQCQFPFTFEGKKYEECARNVEPPPSGGAWSVAKADREHPWCITDPTPTKVKWGYCLLGGGWQTAPETETVVHARVTVPHQAVVLLFVVLCQLVFSSFSIFVLEALEVEENQERRFKEGWRGYGALDTHGPPSYAPGYATTYAPHVQPRMAQPMPRSHPPDAVFHPAAPPMR